MKQLENNVIIFNNNNLIKIISTICEKEEYFVNLGITFTNPDGTIKDLVTILREIGEKWDQICEDDPAGNNPEIREAKIMADLEIFGGIYGYMYGYRSENIPLKEDITYIPKDCLQIGKHKDCFIYIWGWPGPDGNIYYFKDYGKTWSFCIEDLINIYYEGRK